MPVGQRRLYCSAFGAPVNGRPELFGISRSSGSIQRHRWLPDKDKNETNSALAQPSPPTSKNPSPAFARGNLLFNSKSKISLLFSLFPLRSLVHFCDHTYQNFLAARRRNKPQSEDASSPLRLRNRPHRPQRSAGACCRGCFWRLGWRRVRSGPSCRRPVRKAR